MRRVLAALRAPQRFACDPLLRRRPSVVDDLRAAMGDNEGVNGWCQWEGRLDGFKFSYAILGVIQKDGEMIFNDFNVLFKILAGEAVTVGVGDVIRNEF